MAWSHDQRWLNGRLVTSDIARLLEPGTFRTESIGLPLETKAFQGDGVATAIAGQIYPNYFRALTGQGATTAQGALAPLLSYQIAYDTFTDTGGTALQSHAPEVGGWFALQQAGDLNDPTITSNRAQNTATTNYWEGQIGSAEGGGASQTVQADFRRANAFTGALTNENSESIFIRRDGGNNWYEFGWSEVDLTWYLKRVDSNVRIDLTSSTTNVFTGTPQVRTLKMVTTDPSAGTVNIKCYVDGTQVISYDDTDANRLVGGAGYVGIIFNYSTACQFDNFNAEELLFRIALTGYQATTNVGRFTGLPTTVALTGLRATLPTTRLFPPSADQPMTGLVATGLLNAPIRWISTDTFTDTNGTLLSAHVADSGESWTLDYDGGGTDPDINTNRLRANGFLAEWHLGSTSPQNTRVGASIYRDGPGTDYNSAYAVAAVGARLTGTTDADGYYAGVNNFSGFYWVQLEKRIAATSTIIDQYQLPSLPLSTAVLVRMEVVGNATNEVRVYVNDVLRISYDDTSGDLIAPGYVGVRPMYTGAFVHDTFWAGDVGDVVRPILAGKVLTTGYGVLEPAIGGASGVTLTGEVATTAQGTLVPSTGFTVQLTGLGATTAQGTIFAAQSIGTDASSPAVTNVPKLDATVLRNIDGGSYVPGYSYNNLIGFNGVLYTAGHGRAAGHDGLFERQGPYTVGQTFGGWTLGNNYAASELDIPASGFLYFPPTNKYFYNYAGPHYASLTAGGVFQTLAVRYYDYGTSRTTYAAWQSTDLSTVYPGPVFTTQRGNTTETFEPLGFYGYRDDRAIVFYPRRLQVGTGTIIQLAGCRANATLGSFAAVSKVFEFTGRRATTGQGVLVRDPADGNVNAEAALTGLAATTTPGVASVDTTLTGISKTAALTGLVATTTNDIQIGQRIIVVNTSTALVPAFRVARSADVEWSDEVVLDTATGFTHMWVVSGSMVAVPTGYGDLMYAVYLSGVPNANVVTYYVGVAVVDCATRTVVSNTLTAANPSLGGALPTNPIFTGNRMLAEVVTLSNGTSLTQFVLSGNIVHISWTSGTKNTPTVTLKTKPASTTVPRWDTLEYRGDTVKHVLYAFQDVLTVPLETISFVYENDATGTGSTWNTVNTSRTGGTLDATSGNYVLSQTDQFGNGPMQGGNYISGYGGGKYRSFLYVARRAAQDPDGSSKVMVDYWAAQPPIFSQQMSMRVGQVSVSITPNAALTGLRVTTTAPTFAYVAAGLNREVNLQGKRATAVGGSCTPPKITFLLDTFTEPTSNSPTFTYVQLDTHAAEVGGPWVVPGAHSNNIAIFADQAQYNDSIAVQPNVANVASGQSVIRDYVVEAVGTFVGQGAWYADTLNGAIGLRTTQQAAGGYFFGRCSGDHTWLLTRNGVTLARTIPDGLNFSNVPFSIEATGQLPTRLRCRVNGVVVIDHTDSLDDATYDIGYPAVYFQDIYNYVSAKITSINAYYYDPSAFIITGNRATTGQGQLVVAGGLTGQRANTGYGQLDPTTPTTNVNLTGLAATTAQGTIFPAQGEGVLVGQIATTAQGVLVGAASGGNVAIGLMPTQLQTYSGVLGMGQVETPGQIATLYQGAFGFILDAYPTPTGLRANALQGALLPGISDFSILGRSATGSGGLIVPAINVPEDHFRGFRATLTQGVLTPLDEHFVALTGYRATTTGGVLTPVIDEASTTIGQSAACVGGLLTPVATASAVGAQVTCTGGAMVPLIVTSPTGQVSVSAQGVLQVLANIALTGRSGITTAGLVSQTHGCTLFPTGLQMQMFLGDVSEGFTKVKPEWLLWTRASVDDVVATEEMDDETSVVEPNQ